MSDCVLLVDHENITKVELGAIPVGVRVPFFFGASQKSVPTAFLKAALRHGERFVPIDIEGHGKNALDFHIAFYLGEYLARSPTTRCVILSKDKGFDPLVKHLAGRGFTVSRASTLVEAFPSPAPAPALTVAPKPAAAAKGNHQSSTAWDGALAWLAGMQKNKRPRKQKGLLAHLHSHFSKKFSAAELQKVVGRMIAEKKLTEANGALTYHF